MTGPAIWLLCGIVSSTAFAISERKFIRDNANDISELAFLGIVMVVLTLTGPIGLASFLVGWAAKTLVRLIP